MKKAVLWVSIASIVLIIVGFILVIGAGASAAATCGGLSGTSAEVSANVSSGCANGAVAGFGIGSLVLIIGFVLDFVAWLLGLIKTATVGAWGWFVLVFLISPLGSLIYGIAGPDQKKVEAPAGAYPGQPR